MCYKVTHVLQSVTVDTTVTHVSHSFESLKSDTCSSEDTNVTHVSHIEMTHASWHMFIWRHKSDTCVFTRTCVTFVHTWHMFLQMNMCHWRHMCHRVTHVNDTNVTHVSHIGMTHASWHMFIWRHKSDTCVTKWHMWTTQTWHMCHT